MGIRPEVWHPKTLKGPSGLPFLAYVVWGMMVPSLSFSRLTAFDLPVAAPSRP